MDEAVIIASRQAIWGMVPRSEERALISTRWAVGAVYLAAAVTLTWPLATHLTSRLGALEGIGDPYLVLWILGWGSHAWVTDPVSILSALVPPATPVALFRDTLATLYYVRTLPLNVGAEMTLPLNDAGRSMTLRLRVTGFETLRHQGADVSVWRLEPRVLRRVEHRQPLTATVWISADERRLPLVMEVTAGFGRVRATLLNRCGGWRV